MPRTAIFVIGNVKLKASTPRLARTSPPEGRPLATVSVSRRTLVTLSLVVTSERNTIEGELRRLIAVGLPGTQLPSVRELTRRHRASPVTVQRIVTRLEHEGLVDARPGHGTFVAERREPTDSDLSWQTVALGARPLPGDGMSDLLGTVPSGVISLATGYPDASLWPVGLLTAAASRAARRPGVWGRSPVQGIDVLRAWFAADAGPDVSADDVMVVAGGQAALSGAFRSLATPGDPIVVESPTYVGAIEAARLAGLHPVPVPVDGDGIRTDLLGAALRATGASLIYLQPRLANPTGTSLSADRRAIVLALAASHGAFIVEDDFARDFAVAGDPPPLLRNDVDGHVVYVRSLTKATAPALRIAGVVARGPAMARLRNARLVDDFFVSGVQQETALAVVTAPGWTRHLGNLRRVVGERRNAAIAALDAVPSCELAFRPMGGFVLWLRLADHLDDVDVSGRARDAGVLVNHGRPWFCAEPDGAYLRLSLAAVDSANVSEGVRRLGRALGDGRRRPRERPKRDR